ncbi:MAG: hypothetical protein U1F11_09500 [Steroidobacteraceae bacterium]
MANIRDVRELVLLLPDLFLPADSPFDALPPARLPLRFGAARPAGGGWRGWLAQRLELPALALAGEAELVAWGGSAAQGTRAGGDVAATAECCDAHSPEDAEHWLATPVSLQAGLDHVRLPADGVLELDAGGAAELAADFNRVLGGGELELRPVAADLFLLRGLEASGAQTQDPARTLGSDIRDALPNGPGSRELRALASEIELWLHDHAVNRRRAALGLKPVTSLWLWGGGDPLPGGLQPAPPRDDVIVASADAWVAALARAAGAPLRPPAGALDALLAEAADLGIAVMPRVLAGFEERTLAPAVAALRRGALRELWLVANDRAVNLRDADRWRLWRPRRGWLAALH